jgi:putative phosphoesterase
MTVKIAVLSDTHLPGVTKELQAIYDMYLRDKDVILHAGDIVSADVIDFLNAGEFHGVRGNMDPFEVKQRLPDKKVLEIGPYRIGLIHGWGPSGGLEERITPSFQNVDVIVYGHSHHAVKHVKEGTLLFNPGTATGFSFSSTHTIGILELNDTLKADIITL